MRVLVTAPFHFPRQKKKGEKHHGKVDQLSPVVYVIRVGTIRTFPTIAVDLRGAVVA